MTRKFKINSYLEYIFLGILIVVVFIFYSFDRRNPGIKPHQIIFFLNFVIGALIISYVLLPHYLYKKKYVSFILYFSLIIAAVIFVEEGILEQIYFPDTRGKRFLGIFFNLLGTLPTITIITGFKVAWDLLEKQNEVESLKSTIKESELQFLKSQINPHFLFNNLNNIYSHAIENSPQTPEMILELSAFLRYMLYECKARYVPLVREIEQLENFINLSKMQIEERGIVTFKTEGIQSDYRIAPLILMVFVENAFKHSSSSQVEHININVHVELDEKGVLHFSCINNYLSLSNTEEISEGIGLENVRKRLELLYPSAHDIKVNTTNQQYEVKLRLELKKT